MDKPKTLAGLKQVLADLENDKSEFYGKTILKPVNELRQKLNNQNRKFMEAYDEKIRAVKLEIKAKQLELKQKKTKYPEIEKWLDRVYGGGVNWGYGGLKLRYVDPNNMFIIVTNKGTKAGQGTAMGTAGYYYATAENFVVFPQYGTYFRSEMPHGKHTSNQMFRIEGGKLTTENKNNLIKQAKEYCKQYNVQPFNLK